MAKKINKNNSAAKKLIPAAGMLAVSAMMLASSTYAWFTMSREVEVTNIQMTATVPEDLQISLGEISGGSSSINLATNNGFLVSSSDVVGAPTDCDDDDPYDWSNSVSISTYYDFGKLIPAGSTNGENVFFTPDAAGVGKTLKDVATAYKAAEAATAQSESGTGAGSGKYNATAHIKTAAGENTWAGGGTGNYTTASAWNNTNDDGYYIDIPIWLRTSSTTAPSVYVTGYIKDGSNASSAADADGDELYKAVRVAVLNASGAAAGGVLELSDQTGASPAVYPTAQIADASSLIDSGIANGNFSLTGVNALKDIGAMATGLYDTVTVNKGATVIGTLTAKAADSASQYAAGTKFIIRVWLEGDDVNCWNANAGQDFSINLKFSKGGTNPSGG